MFAFSDEHWPGIAKLVEESGELQQVLGKLIMTGGKPEHWDGTNLIERLQDEMADLKAAMIFVAKHCDLDGKAMDERAARKLARFERWHELGRDVQAIR